MFQKKGLPIVWIIRIAVVSPGHKSVYILQNINHALNVWDLKEKKLSSPTCCCIIAYYGSFTSSSEASGSGTISLIWNGSSCAPLWSIPVAVQQLLHSILDRAARCLTVLRLSIALSASYLTSFACLKEGKLTLCCAVYWDIKLSPIWLWHCRKMVAVREFVEVWYSEKHTERKDCCPTNFMLYVFFFNCKEWYVL